MGINMIWFGVMLQRQQDQFNLPFGFFGAGSTQCGIADTPARWRRAAARKVESSDIYLGSIPWCCCSCWWVSSSPPADRHRLPRRGDQDRPDKVKIEVPTESYGDKGQERQPDELFTAAAGRRRQRVAK